MAARLRRIQFRVTFRDFVTVSGSFQRVKQHRSFPRKFVIANPPSKEFSLIKLGIDLNLPFYSMLIYQRLDNVTIKTESSNCVPAFQIYHCGINSAFQRTLLFSIAAHRVQSPSSGGFKRIRLIKEIQFRVKGMA